MRGARIFTAMVAVAWTTGCAARQAPRPAVAVLEVRGADGAQWEERAAELAEARHYQIIPADTYWVMATRLKARPLTARNVARVAAAVGAVAVVHGRVTGARRRRVVTMYVRAGDTGRVVEKHRVRLRGSRRARGEAALERRLLASLPEAPDEASDAQPAGPDRRAARARPVGKEKAAAKAGPVAKRPAKAEPLATTKTPSRVGPAAKPVAKRPARAEPVAKPKAPAKANRTAAAKANRTAAAKRDDPPPPEPVEYDDRGQAIDDEMPSTLK